MTTKIIVIALGLLKDLTFGVGAMLYIYLWMFASGAMLLMHLIGLLIYNAYKRWNSF